MESDAGLETPARRRRRARRDPEGARRRILAAATREFARHGFAGARMDRIARLARTNLRHDAA